MALKVVKYVVLDIMEDNAPFFFGQFVLGQWSILFLLETSEIHQTGVSQGSES